METLYRSVRLGFVVDFLSHATIVGFMAGAATVVSLQQLKGMLGLNHFTNETDLIDVMRSVFTQLHLVNLPLSSLSFLRVFEMIYPGEVDAARLFSGWTAKMAARSTLTNHHESRYKPSSRKYKLNGLTKFFKV